MNQHELKQWSRKADDITRRSFVNSLAKGLLGVSALPFIPQAFSAGDIQGVNPNAKVKNVIFLYASGGMSHMDTFDPKDHADSKGPTNKISTSADGVQIAHHFPKLAKQAHNMAIVRSVTSQTGDHAGGSYFMHTGYRRQPGTSHPQMGPWAQKFLGRRNELLPDSVAIMAGNPGPGFFPAEYSPLPIGDPSKGIKDLLPKIDRSQFDHRMEMARQFTSNFEKEYTVPVDGQPLIHPEVKAYTDFYDETLKFFSDEATAAFDISKEPGEVRNSYGNSRFGRGCLLARRLIENNVRFVEVGGLGGWDYHGGAQAVERLAPGLDTGFSALLADLERTGLLDTTLVVLATEFGRTPINERGGRDHNPGVFSCILAGAGIKGGMTYGVSDERGRKPAENPVSVQDFHATIATTLGLPINQRIHGSGGRPFFVANRGKPITDIIA